MANITYYFTMNSPWAYIGHEAFLGLARRHKAAIGYRPVSLAALFPETGGLPLPKRHPARQKYRLLELSRWREKRGIPLNVHPEHWPFDPSLADKAVIAAVDLGWDPADFILKGMRGIWTEERNLGDPMVVKDIAGAAALDGDRLLAAASEPSAADRYDRNTKDAIESGCIGSPTYVLAGEPFWGQDRLDMLEDALRSGRQPFRAAG